MAPDRTSIAASSLPSLSVFQVEGNAKDRKKPEFINFKRILWHESFFHIIESIVLYTKSGCWLKCGDGYDRCLFPIIMVLSVDYEEQYTSFSHGAVLDLDT
jgi:hypothetical protein